MSKDAPVRVATIGLNHSHIYTQTKLMLKEGAELVSFYAPEEDLAAAYAKQFPQAARVKDERQILEDKSVHMVISAAIPCERAPLGIRVMRHGKDFMSDKPGFTTLAQLAEARRTQRETKRIYSVCFMERFGVPAVVHAGELVERGAIGRVLQTIGVGPHRLNAPTRKPWFFKPAENGGALCDVAMHQMDMFLTFTGSTSAEVVSSRVGNLAHPEYPKWEDFGEAVVTGNGGEGYVRVDWFTPDGLPTWGDGRLTIMGTEGYIELRNYVDLAGRPGTDHLFLVDKKEVRYINCTGMPLPYGKNLVADIRNRTETAMTQDHCFLASELALQAQSNATWVESKTRRTADRLRQA
jgi:predicted dehydrogenase